MLKHIKFIDNHGSFCVNRPENTSYLYFPLASEAGLKSSVTPVLGGDSKIDQDTFLLEPVSSENLHNNRSSRNFWIVKEGHIPYSVTGSSTQQEADRFTDRQEDRLCSGEFTLTIYFRLFIAELFPELDKAVYIDSDTVINDDIAKLYSVDMGDAMFGAV